MNCPKCNKQLRADLFCETCNDYPYKTEKTKNSHNISSSKTFYIILCCILSVAVLIIGCIAADKSKINQIVNREYNDIVTEVNKKDYYSAIQDLKKFKEDYADKSKKISSKAAELENKIESGLYSDRNSEDIGTSSCKTYLEYYPNGKYAKEIKKSLSELSEKQALKSINNAKSDISKNDVLAADAELQSVINNSYISDELKKQADELSKSIANKVADEKGKKMILGTWTKATGVQYIFEENGHMSMKLLSKYNASAGTTLDGFEVKGILKEINECGRILRGGLWEYNGIATQNGKQYAAYTLLSQSSYYNCIIPIDKPDELGIILQSGIGDMSYLFK